MPGPVAEGPLVSKSFANNFWGKDDAGFHPLLERMHNAKVTCDELKAFYNTRGAIEDDYARKLMALCRKPLGSCEAGTLRASLDIMRGEVESMGKSHQGIAAQMKSELEEPLAAFAGGMKERRKIVQSGVEKLYKVKLQQTQAVNKSRDRYEQDCLKIKGYLAQGHMVMGQEERKNKAKMEKTQIQLASTSNDYEAAIKALEETTGRWNRDWKAACDKFQDLEEERLDFMKSSLWTFANIASTVCVSDDASCEKIRVSLESCEVEKDIASFIEEKGTGQEIPDPPKYINFCRGELNDTASEASEDERYSVAQFQRTINPAFRSSSPQPSVFESHHDPQSDLAMRMGHQESNRPPSRETKISPQKSAIPPSQIDYRRHAHRDPQPDLAMRMGHQESNRPPSREATITPQKSTRPPSQIDYRRNVHHDPQSNPTSRLGQSENKRPPSRETIITPQNSARPPSQIDYRRNVHHDPQSNLTSRLGQSEKNRPPSRETKSTPQKSARPPSQIDYRRNFHHDPQSDPTLPLGQLENNRPPSRETTTTTTTTPQKFARPASQIDYRRQAQAQAQTQFQHSKIEALATVPHNEYPTDGMTMFCRTAPPSERSSATSPNRPSSRDSQSEYSNPTSFSSQEHASGKHSPVKQNTAPIISPTKEIQKKRSGFFSSNSPFRRKSKQDKEGRDLGTTPILTPSSRNTWTPSTTRNVGSVNSSPTRSYARGNQSASSRDKYSVSPEPVDPRANFQLNVGPNVFDVASPDTNRNKPTPDPLASTAKEVDPIAQALAEIKLAEQKGIDKQSSTRISADRYHGIATPAPPGTPVVSATTTRQSDHAAAQRGTPPPSYHDQTPIKRLDPPKPAFTSAQMQQTTRKYISQTKDMYGSSRPGTSSTGSEIPRAVSPLPIRSVSPRPGYNSVQGQGQGYARTTSPNPESSASNLRRPQSGSPTKPSYSNENPAGDYPRRGSSNMVERAVSPQPQFARQERPSRAVSPQPQFARQETSRAVSPQPQFSRQERPSSSSGAMALQLAEPDNVGSQKGRASTSRPLSYYGGSQSHGNEVGRHVVSEGRTRSKSVADGRKYTQDGRPILQFARAMYVYHAAIPEELSFAKGDVLAVLRLQDDGWWEAEVTGKNGRAGLVPSNYLQLC